MFVTDKFYIGYSDISLNLELSNSSVLKMFEDIATMHGALIKDGPKDTDSRWFLTAYKVNIKKRLGFADRITIKTWSREIKGVTASREFEIYDENGESIGTALSNWVRINPATQRLERIPEEVGNAYASESFSNYESAWIEKLKEPETSEYSKEYYIDRNFLDANNHMNNVRYLDLVKNVIPEDLYNKPESKNFTLMYKKAIPCGATVKCLFSQTEKDYTVTIKSQDLSDLHAVLYFKK